MNGQQSMFDEQLYDYLFVIEPDAATAEVVKGLKQLLHDRIVLSWQNLNSKPHLSLFEFRNVETAEEGIIRKTAEALKNIQPFTVQLDGAETFLHGNTLRSLVLKLKEPKPVSALQSAIRRELHLRQQKLTPHVTIAGKIPVKNFNLLESAEEFDYRGGFVCAAVTILKRPADGSKGFVVVHREVLT